MLFLFRLNRLSPAVYNGNLGFDETQPNLDFTTGDNSQYIVLL